MRERAEGEKIQGKCAASSASDTRIRAGIVKDHETILLLSVFSLITGQHRHRKLWSCHFLVFCWQWSLLNRNTKTLCVAIGSFVILDYPWRRGSGGQWGEIPDINELVPDPVSRVSSIHSLGLIWRDVLTFYVDWRFYHRGDEKSDRWEMWRNTAAIQFPNLENKMNVWYFWWIIICYPCIRVMRNFLNVWWRNYSRERRWGVCQLSNFGC